MRKATEGCAMTRAHRVALAVRRIFLGKLNQPQQCNVGIDDPQAEVSVWLHGIGAPRDVTFTHSIACAAPFTICIGGGVWPSDRTPGKRFALQFREHANEKQLLADLTLRQTATILTKGPALHLFQVESCKNYCLPKGRLWAHYLHLAYLQSRSNSHIRMSACEAHAMIAAFICPRPVVLVSAVSGNRSNLFPMNLLGNVGDGYFAFALDSSRLAAPLVAAAGTIALSSIPMEHSEMARQLGKNHKQETISWNQLPFPTRPSTALSIPVPCFASRVIEMQIESTRNLGSHTFFVARVVRDERRSDGQQFFMIHGIYQSWRLANYQEPYAPAPDLVSTP
ncbi:MAG: flavin reductase [Acidobacteriaceae bacterium]|jgi:flavin reductase (DIM6/NTAB) family NADH-FMN oxidoreductase RutF